MLEVIMGKHGPALQQGFRHPNHQVIEELPVGAGSWCDLCVGGIVDASKSPDALLPC